MRKRDKTFIALFVVTVISGTILLPRLYRQFMELHARNVVTVLAEWEVEYRDSNDTRMLSYVENYYRYEDMHGYRGTELAKELAEQRERTLDAIRKGIAKSKQQK